MINALLIGALAALIDMTRGGKFQNVFGRLNFARKPICMTLLAIMIMLIVGYSHWAWLFVIWFGLIGWRAGTGDPMGKAATSHATVKSLTVDNLEAWQFTDNAWWSLAFLGLLWTWPAIPLAFINPEWLLAPILYAVSFPLGGIIGRKFFDLGDEAWIAAEGLRSGIAMFLFCMIVTNY